MGQTQKKKYHGRKRKRGELLCEIKGLLGHNEKVMNVDDLVAYTGLYKSKIHKLTHITTNLDFSQIGHRYGRQISDRFVRMFNRLKLDGPSRRK